MIPPVIDAVLTEAIATSRMVEAGRDYWRRGRVGELRVDGDHGIVRAAVKGSARSPYQVELRFRLDAGRIVLRGRRGSDEQSCNATSQTGTQASLSIFCLVRHAGGGRSAAASIYLYINA